MPIPTHKIKQPNPTLLSIQEEIIHQNNEIIKTLKLIAESNARVSETISKPIFSINTEITTPDN